MNANPDLPSGSPVAAAVIGARDLDTSIGFYRDVLGFELIDRRHAGGPAFERHWGLPAGAGAEVALLESNGLGVGGIQLIEFAATTRQDIWTIRGFLAFGLCNINFYTPDIHEASRYLVEHGCQLWSEPTHYDLESDVGAPTEVVLTGYDTVPINLVELTTGEPDTTIGQMRVYVESIGYNSKGFSPVVTTAHVVRSLEVATRFYERVLGMGVMFDDELNRIETNEFLGLPRDGRTRIRFMQGNHMFGKLALAEPVNYECTDLSKIALPPNVGYIAQRFVVDDLGAALNNCRGLDCVMYSDVEQTELAGIGRGRSFIVRHPGSGGLQEIIELD